jgi:hypothetical protein
VAQGKGLAAMDPNGSSDPYVMVDLVSAEDSDNELAWEAPRSVVRNKTLNPVWNVGWSGFASPLSYHFFLLSSLSLSLPCLFLFTARHISDSLTQCWERVTIAPDMGCSMKQDDIGTMMIVVEVWDKDTLSADDFM